MTWPSALSRSRRRPYWKPQQAAGWSRGGSLDANEFSSIAASEVTAVFPDQPEPFLARIPYAYYDETLIRRELTDAGFTNTRYETRTDTSSAPSPRHVALALCQGTPQRTEIEDRDPGLLDEVTNRVERRIAAQQGDGPVTAPIKGHIITASHGNR